MCGIDLEKWRLLHEPSLSVAVWPRGLPSDKHTNKEESGGGKDPPKVCNISTATKRAHMLMSSTK